MTEMPKETVEQGPERGPAGPEAESSAPEDGARGFCPISLGDWLALCREADVPHVPAARICDLVREDCLSFDVPGDHQERLRAAFQKMEKARLPGHMMRFDYCASLEVKISLADGEWECRPEFCRLELDDPRAFDILFEYPRPTAPVWLRPWEKTLIADGYPVEYRAFVRDGEVLGISSYYPQRPLPEFPEFLEHIHAVRDQTERLIRAVRTPFQWHLKPSMRGLDRDGVHFTADFIATRNGIIFLEGGPPNELGAHPCCFRDGEISGVALEDRNQE